MPGQRPATTRCQKIPGGWWHTSCHDASPASISRTTLDRRGPMRPLCRWTCESHSPVGSPGGALRSYRYPLLTVSVASGASFSSQGKGASTMATPKVLIAGAGLGGLCLAQALRRHEIDVAVFERDASPWDRPQGYRLHIDADGVDALYHALTPELYQLFDATAMKPLPFTTVVDTNLAIQRRQTSDEHGSTETHAFRERPSHVNVHRATLRQILLTGLENIVQ